MKRFLILVAAAVLLASCTQEATVSITPDVSSWTFGPEGGEFTVILFTNGHWSASCNDDAISFAPDTGDFSSPMHVVVGKNTEHYTKAMHIKLLTQLDGVSRSSKVVITQQCEPFIFCDEPFKTIGPEGGAVRFTVNSNMPWTVEKGLSFVVEPASGGPNSTEVTFWIPAGSENQERTFSARLALDDDPSKCVELIVKQTNN